MEFHLSQRLRNSQTRKVDVEGMKDIRKPATNISHTEPQSPCCFLPSDQQPGCGNCSSIYIERCLAAISFSGSELKPNTHFRKNSSRPVASCSTSKQTQITKSNKNVTFVIFLWHLAWLRSRLQLNSNGRSNSWDTRTASCRRCRD